MTLSLRGEQFPGTVHGMFSHIQDLISSEGTIAVIRIGVVHNAHFVLQLKQIYSEEFANLEQNMLFHFRAFSGE